MAQKTLWVSRARASKNRSSDRLHCDPPVQCSVSRRLWRRQHYNLAPYAVPPFDVSPGCTRVSSLLNNSIPGGAGSSALVQSVPSPPAASRAVTKTPKVFKSKNSQVDSRENRWYDRSLASRTRLPSHSQRADSEERREKMSCSEELAALRDQ
jgi:hypothetical protein